MERIGEILPEVEIYQKSVQQLADATFMLGKLKGKKVLIVVGKKPKGIHGKRVEKSLYLCPTDSRNLKALMSLFPFLKPKPAWLRRSVGFGDRLGLATPGHIRAAVKLGVFPILAQQSSRELQKTGRDFREVLEAAAWGVFQEGYVGGYGSDADHLSTLDEVRRAAKAGFTGFTLDISKYVQKPKNVEKEASYWARPREIEKDYSEFYIAPDFVITFNRDEALELCARFAKALQFVFKTWVFLRDFVGEFDLEISMDELPNPTTPKEHFFFVRELKLRGVKITSFAPRFVHGFEKAIDYSGNLEELRRNLREHYLIAQHLGPYKISIHSGSDKHSVYPLLEDFQPVHIKTSGVSYLLALEILRKSDPALFDELTRLAAKSYRHEAKSYAGVVSAKPSEVSLEGRGRQVLHVTYGPVLRKFGRRLRTIILEREEEYYSLLEQYFSSFGK